MSGAYRGEFAVVRRATRTGLATAWSDGCDARCQSADARRPRRASRWSRPESGTSLERPQEGHEGAGRHVLARVLNAGPDGATLGHHAGGPSGGLFLSSYGERSRSVKDGRGGRRVLSREQAMLAGEQTMRVGRFGATGFRVNLRAYRRVPAVELVPPAEAEAARIWRQIDEEQILPALSAETGEEFVEIYRREVTRFDERVTALAELSRVVPSMEELEQLYIEAARNFGGDPWEDVIRDSFADFARAAAVLARLERRPTVDSPDPEEAAAVLEFSGASTGWVWCLACARLMFRGRARANPSIQEVVRLAIMECGRGMYVAVRRIELSRRAGSPEMELEFELPTPGAEAAELEEQADQDSEELLAKH
jgi:hypothetical protein